jgi:hypothetical protein
MKRDYLGDSYDAVKRLWHDVFAGWATLYAEPDFIPKDLHKDFTRLTKIPILNNRRPRKYSILNDPDTGIVLPGKSVRGHKHISLKTVIKQLRGPNGPCCVVTFDQSNYRKSGQNLKKQRQRKLRYLRDNGIFAFYYVSHAPFLFAFINERTLRELEDRLISTGIPDRKLQ